MKKLIKLFNIAPFLRFFVFPAKVKRQKCSRDVIVSVTSYSSRMKWLPMTLASVLLERRVKHVFVFIAESEEIPWNLKKFVHENRDDVSLIRTADIRSYKKLYPMINVEHIALSSDREKVARYLKDHEVKGVITVDDDIIYLPGSLVLPIIDPTSIVCSIAHKKNKNIKYRNWSTLKPGRYKAKTALAIGAGGVFYPKDFIYSARDCIVGADFEFYCPNQDDLWWNLIQTQKNWTVTVVNTKIIKLDNLFRMKKLSSSNVKDGNDAAIERLLKKWDNFI